MAGKEEVVDKYEAAIIKVEDEKSDEGQDTSNEEKLITGNSLLITEIVKSPLFFSA